MSASFDDVADVTLERLRHAVLVSGANREFFEIWVVGRPIPTVPPQWPFCRVG